MFTIRVAVLALCLILSKNTLGAVSEECRQLYTQFTESTTLEIAGERAIKMQQSQCWPALQDPPPIYTNTTPTVPKFTSCEDVIPYLIALSKGEGLHHSIRIARIDDVQDLTADMCNNALAWGSTVPEEMQQSCLSLGVSDYLLLNPLLDRSIRREYSCVGMATFSTDGRKNVHFFTEKVEEEEDPFVALIKLADVLNPRVNWGGWMEQYQRQIDAEQEEWRREVEQAREDDRARRVREEAEREARDAEWRRKTEAEHAERVRKAKERQERAEREWKEKEAARKRRNEEAKEKRAREAKERKEREAARKRRNEIVTID